MKKRFSCLSKYTFFIFILTAQKITCMFVQSSTLTAVFNPVKTFNVYLSLSLFCILSCLFTDLPSEKLCCLSSGGIFLIPFFLLSVNE